MAGDPVEPFGRTIHLPRPLHDQVCTACLQTWPHEACGLLIAAKSAPDTIIDIVIADNVANDPASAFEIDPNCLIEAHLTARARQQEIVGCFHSHPDGSVRPSMTDRDQATQHGFLWMIVGGDGTGRDVAVEIYRAIHPAQDAMTGTSADDSSTDLRYFRRCKIVF
ncbi:M67 family metallopeptidase [Thalassospira sp. MA62]|nr:M67 family metallopeptidase [Thalassospira sp. MA62]